jgi:AcrR family transcriptional regulator
MQNQNPTQQKLIHAALTHFFTQGIQKTTMDQIAQQAQLTRITAYRHFTDKQTLIRAAVLSTTLPFQNALLAIQQTPHLSIDDTLNIIGAGLAMLPTGDFPSFLLELKSLHPKIAQEFNTTRLTLVQAIFTHLFTQARQQGQLRPDIQQEIAEVLFLEVAKNTLANPHLKSLNLTPIQIFNNIKNIFLHGILKEI